MPDVLLEAESDNQGEEKFDFSSPEDVLIEVLCENEAYMGDPIWADHLVESCTVINGKDGVNGAASYEQSYGSFLAAVVEDLIDCPGAGWFVILGVTGVYTKGDWGFTDDDMDFYCEGFRPATAEERKLA